MPVVRGEIRWLKADKRRPVIIVSSDRVLANDIWQTHYIPLTSNLERAGTRGRVFIDSRSLGLEKDSVADVLSLSVARRRDLDPKPVGSIPRDLMVEIDNTIVDVLGID